MRRAGKLWATPFISLILSYPILPLFPRSQQPLWRGRAAEFKLARPTRSETVGLLVLEHISAHASIAAFFLPAFLKPYTQIHFYFSELIFNDSPFSSSLSFKCIFLSPQEARAASRPHRTLAFGVSVFTPPSPPALPTLSRNITHVSLQVLSPRALPPLRAAEHRAREPGGGPDSRQRHEQQLAAPEDPHG